MLNFKKVLAIKIISCIILASFLSASTAYPSFLRVPVEKIESKRILKALFSLRGFFYGDLEEIEGKSYDVDEALRELLRRQAKDGFGYAEYWDSELRVRDIYERYARSSPAREKYDDYIGGENKNAKVTDTKQLGAFRAVKSLWRPLRRIAFPGTKLKGNPDAVNDGCFICIPNMAPLQKGVRVFDRINNSEFVALANPFQILRNHITLALIGHKPQEISLNRIRFILEFTEKLKSFRFAFNSIGAAASIPKHLHFQGTDERLPIEDIKEIQLFQRDGFTVNKLDKPWPNLVYVVRGDKEEVATFIMYMIDGMAYKFPGDKNREKRAFNILFSHDKNGEVKVYFTPRRKERSSNFGNDFGFCEMSGLIVCEKTKDFETVDSEDIIQASLSECGYPQDDAGEIESIFDNAIDRSTFVKNFASNEGRNILLVGGKGASLSELANIPGIDVPEGFYIITPAYDRFIAQNNIIGLIKELEDLSEQWIKYKINKEEKAVAKIESLIYKKSKEIKATMENSEIQDDVKQEIILYYNRLSQQFGEADGLSVAVRSSATAEDLPTASFAGQQDTFLNQKGADQVLGAVRKCWISLYGVRAVYYRNQQRLATIKETTKEENIDLASISKDNPIFKHSKVKICAVVQRMIEAYGAGVGFTIDRATGYPAISVGANYGLGESVVSGQVTPDSWLVEKGGDHRIIRKRLGEKARAVYFAEKGIAWIETDGEKRKEYVFEDKEVKEIAAKIETIGDYYKSTHEWQFVDVEYAVNDKGRLYFLQARPETIWSQDVSVIIVNEEAAKEATPVFKGGLTGSFGAASGILRIAERLEDAEKKVDTESILVTTATVNQWTQVLTRAKAVVTNIGGEECHAALVMGELGRPAIVGTNNGLEALRAYEGTEVTVDANNKTIYLGKLPLEKGTISHSISTNRGLDLQTAGESWEEATKIGQTIIDSEGQRLIGKPIDPVEALQQDVYIKCHKRAAAILDCGKIVNFIKDGVHYVMFGDIFKFRERIREFSLEELEKLEAARRQSFKEYLQACSDFDGSPESFLRFADTYVALNAYMSMQYDVLKVTEGLLQNKFTIKGIPDIYRPAIRNSNKLKKTESSRKITDYIELLRQIKENDRLKLLFSSGKATEDIISELRQDLNAFYEEVRHYVSLYKISKSTDLKVAFQPVLYLIIEELGRDVNNSLPMVAAEVDREELYYPEDTRLNRIARLAVNAQLLREDAHHIKVRGQWLVRDKIEGIAEELVKKGNLSETSEIFNRDLNWILEQIVLLQSAKQAHRSAAKRIETVPESTKIFKRNQNHHANELLRTADTLWLEGKFEESLPLYNDAQNLYVELKDKNELRSEMERNLAIVADRIWRVNRAIRERNEFLDVYTRDGRKTGQQLPRQEIHREGTIHATVGLISIAPNGQLILQRRGLNKNRFPGRLILSVCGHTEIEDGDVIASLKREAATKMGIDIDDEKLIKIGSQDLAYDQYVSYKLYEFTALTEDELQKLLAVKNVLRERQQGRDVPLYKGVLFDYSEKVGTLAIYVLGDDIQAKLEEAKEFIEQQTGIVASDANHNREVKALFVYKLSEEELKAVRPNTDAGVEGFVFQDKHPSDLSSDFMLNPEKYTDTFVPTFTEPAIVNDIESAITLFSAEVDFSHLKELWNSI